MSKYAHTEGAVVPGLTGGKRPAAFPFPSLVSLQKQPDLEKQARALNLAWFLLSQPPMLNSQTILAGVWPGLANSRISLSSTHDTHTEHIRPTIMHNQYTLIK